MQDRIGDLTAGQTGAPTTGMCFGLTKVYQCYAAVASPQKKCQQDIMRLQRTPESRTFKAKSQSTAAETSVSLIAYLHNITLKALP